MRISKCFVGTAVVGGAFVIACGVDEPCDPGQEVSSSGACVTPSMDSANDAGMASTPEGLGDPCAMDIGETGECPETAPYCSKPPGAAEGICSPTGCQEDPALCGDYSCFDLAGFLGDDTQPSICTN